MINGINLQWDLLGRVGKLGRMIDGRNHLHLLLWHRLLSGSRRKIDMRRILPQRKRREEQSLRRINKLR
jgi:hypothetical protein